MTHLIRLAIKRGIVCRIAVYNNANRSAAFRFNHFRSTPYATISTHHDFAGEIYAILQNWPQNFLLFAQ